MNKQNYANHKRYVPLFHFVLFGIIVSSLIGSLVNFSGSFDDRSRLYSAILLVTANISLLMLFFFARIFSLRAQDRVIRMEESFRHYLLTGGPLDPAVRMQQVIALRFAPDDEFVALARRATENGMAGNEIKKAIKNWRPDNHRA